MAVNQPVTARPAEATAVAETAALAAINNNVKTAFASTHVHPNVPARVAAPMDVATHAANVLPAKAAHPALAAPPVVQAAVRPTVKTKSAVTMVAAESAAPVFQVRVVKTASAQHVLPTATANFAATTVAVAPAVFAQRATLARTVPV